MAFLRSWTLALGTGTALLVAGCAAHDPSTDPTYACTPETGGSPYPCVRVQKDIQVERDRLYAEAEVVLRKRWVEYERIYRAGGVDEPTAVMRETMTGGALADALKLDRQIKADQERAVGGAFKLSHITRVPDAVVDGSVVTLQACLDMTSVRFKTPERDLPGVIALQRVYFSTAGGHLLASHLESKEVKACE